MKPAMMGVFVPWEAADAKYQSFILFFISFIILVREVVINNLSADRGTQVPPCPM